MKRTLIATASLIALMFAASFFVERTPAQGSLLKPLSGWTTVGGHRIERFDAGGTCVVIVTKEDQFSAMPCR